jgi:hypothetical protein
MDAGTSKDTSNGDTYLSPLVLAAAEFVAAQYHGAERILEKHYPLPGSGVCAGCSATLTRYPCVAARIAEIAMQHPGFRAPRRNPKGPDPSVGYWCRLAGQFWGLS